MLDLLAAYAAMLTLLVAAAFAFARRYGWEWKTLLLLCAGALVRVLYVLHTPFSLRGYDVDGHVQYVQYAYHTWSMPLASDGWQFYQPPLYYFLAAAWAHIGRLFLDAEGVLVHMQWLSVLLSLWMLLLAFAIGSELFARDDRRRFLVFATVMAFLPGIVFFASRISNESLFHPLSFLFFWLLLRWWKEGGRLLLLLCAFTVAVACLVKVTGAVLCAILIACLLLRRGDSWREKGKCLALVLLLLVSLTAWFPIKRVFLEPNAHRTLTFNNAYVNGQFTSKNDASSLLTLNPLSLVREPFNSPWDSPRRFFFPEYFWRTVFFGEFIFTLSALASVILALSLGLFLFFAYGLWNEIRRPGLLAYPLLITLGCFTVAFLAYRLAFPFVVCQDFRFGLLIAVPITALLVNGIIGARKQWSRAGMALLIVSALCWAWFLVFAGEVWVTF